jgi:hypothetical protein
MAIEEANLAAKKRNPFANLESQQRDLAIKQGSHHAQQGWFRAKQIEALAVHFQGRLPSPPPEDKRTAAWVAFRDLLHKLQNSEEYRLTDEERITWEQLRPNFFGRTADAELFTMGEFAKAADTMREGISRAEQLDWRTNPEKRHFLAFMYYKRAIALALSLDASGARAALAEAAGLAGGAEADARLNRFGAFRDVAEALLTSPAEQVGPLARILHAESQELRTRIRDRDTRQLMLFVAAYLQELLQANEGVASAAAAADIPNTQQIEALIETLLDPLRQTHTTVGGNYRNLVQQSARRAVEIQLAEEP